MRPSRRCRAHQRYWFAVCRTIWRCSGSALSSPRRWRRCTTGGPGRSGQPVSPAAEEQPRAQGQRCHRRTIPTAPGHQLAAIRFASAGNAPEASPAAARPATGGGTSSEFRPPRYNPCHQASAAAMERLHSNTAEPSTSTSGLLIDLPHVRGHSRHCVVLGEHTGRSRGVSAAR